MNNRELTPKEIAEIQLNYPPDSRIELVQMNDKWAVPPGTRGTVDYVDDAGQIHMKWDNGRTLALFHRQIISVNLPGRRSNRSNYLPVWIRDKTWQLR